MKSSTHILVVCLLGFCVQALAADAETEALKRRFEQLMERITAQEKQLQELRSEQTAIMQQLENNRAASTPVAGFEPQATTQPPAPSAAKASVADRLRVGGYGSMRFEANDAPGSAEGFTFRRFVLTTDANITSRLRVYTETEFERLFGIEVGKEAGAGSGGIRFSQGVEGNNAGEIGIEQAWGQYNFAENHGIRAGIVLPPLGRFNILHDDDYWDLPRRTLVDRDAPVTPIKVAWRDLGAGLAGRFSIGAAGKLDYQIYVLNGARLDFNLHSAAQTRNPRRSKLALEGDLELASGFFDGSESARAITWRTAFSPSLAGEFAISGYHGRYTPGYLGVKEPVNSLGFDYKWRHGAFDFEGEAIYTSLGRTRRVLDAFARTATFSTVETSSAEARLLESEIEFELTGLARTRYGFWSDFKYHWRPAWLKRTFLGRSFDDPRLVPILRYERVWLNRNVSDLAFRNGAITNLETDDLQQERVSLGMTYRPVSSFGIQFAYEHNRRVSGERLIFPRTGASSTNGFLSGLVFSF